MQQIQGRRIAYRNGTPASKATQQFVSTVEQFIGDVYADTVDALKHAVALSHDRMQLLADKVLDYVWLPAGRNHQTRDQQLFQFLLISNKQYQLTSSVQGGAVDYCLSKGAKYYNRVV